MFSTGDAFIKAAGAATGVFVIAFFVTLFSAIPSWFARPADERWREFWRMRHPRLVHLRAAAGVAAGLFGIHAFTHLPLAEAYALIFLMPAFTTLLSVLALGERVGWRRWLAVGLGFLGVLVAVRPGFREVGLAHLAAAGCAFGAAITVTVLRRIGNEEKRTSLIGAVFLWGVLVNGALMAPGFAWPAPQTLLALVLAGFCAGLGQLCLMAATRAAPAARIAPMQYSQILWAVLLGALFFAEYPDTLTLAGLALVALSGLLTLLRDEVRSGWLRRVPLLRERP